VKRLALVVLLAGLVAPAFGQVLVEIEKPAVLLAWGEKPNRGVLLEKVSVSEPQPLTGIEVKAQLAAVMPFWSTGNDLTTLQPLFGVAVVFPQPGEKWRALLCPDAATAFVTATELGTTQRFRPGASVDWATPLKFVSATVVVVFSEGAAFGAKTTLAQF
jgi:hypothetical protein